MRIVQYTSGDIGVLRALASKLPRSSSLRYPEFVDYYYATANRCSLLFAVDDNEDILAVMGMERMDFVTPDGKLVLGFGSNARSFRAGAFIALFYRYLKNCDFGLAFGGTESIHMVYRNQNWTYYSNVPVLCFNKVFDSWPGEAWWKRAAKSALRRAPIKVDVAERARRVLREGSMPVDAIEAPRFTEDLLPRQTPFTFRFCPSIEHLNWRYNTELAFVRYRLFRVVYRGDTIGYVVINEQPDRLLVAQCDGEDPLVLAAGILAALGRVCEEGPRQRAVVLSATHAVMREAFRRFGFREERPGRPFAVGGLRNAPRPPIPEDSSQWLVNLDWGDNGLRAPFLGNKSI